MLTRVPPALRAFPFLVALAVLARVLPSAASAQVTDPKITEWLTARSYARVYTTAANRTAGTSATTWSGVTSPFYSDIQRVVYSNNYVYLYATGMPSYIAGNWLGPAGEQYGNWPKNRAAIHRIPRTITIPTTKTKTNGSGGILLNGVYIWANGDAQSYDNTGSPNATTATIASTGDGIWNRLAGVAEDFNFDPAKGHHPPNGAYHNHVNPLGLRYQLGDHVSYNSSTKTYADITATAPTAHSPLLGFANDGLPIYGPYGYSTATDASSGIRRMTSGFVKRNGQTTNKTTGLPNTNISAVSGVTGRTTLPVWAASVQGRSTTLTSAQYGPRSDATYANGPTTNPCSIGLFAEDYDYLGDLGYTQGVDFDLNRQNVRYCVTPEYPSGTYAYFVCIDASGTTVFPDIINQEFFATAAGGQGTVTSISETVTEYVKGGQASALTLAAATASGGTGVTLTWPSVEGATYTAAYSNDGTTYTTLSSALTATLGSTASYTTTTVAPFYKITLSALATYDTSGNGGVSGLNTFATATYSAAATAPSITTQPTSATVTAGASVTFTVVASGTAPLTYQWSKTVSGVTTAISGATSASYTIASTVTGDAGAYSVVVTNSAGSATSSAATLTVNAAATAPSITTQPSTTTVASGASATFNVVASGTAPLTYQWYKNNVAISGATSASYTVASANTSALGAYRVVVTNSAGSATSDLVALLLSSANTPAASAVFNAWQTGATSRRYARVKEQTSSTSTVSTWPSTGLTNMNTGSAKQSSPAYADVQLVRYSADYVYVNASGLPSHVMGPWYINGQIFGNWPLNQNIVQRFPRVPAAATSANRYATTGGANGLWVNGVAVFNMSDDYSYKNSTAADVQRTGDGIWNRDANLAEVATFDPAYAHQPGSGQYHYHANPKGLRYSLGDNVTYNAATNAYSETVAAATAHSPVLGYAWDGYPIYGPYGYATAFDTASGIRRMTTGYQLRNGTNGTANLASTGRVTLPKWAATLQNRSQTLTSSQYGPAVSAAKPLGTYQEDYDYLGDLGKTLGTDFDLDVYNGRFCVTPEYPNGTYAYFVTIDASASPTFPYVTGRQFYGVASGGAVTTISETVTEHKRGGPASALTASATTGAGSTVDIAYTAAEGATYTVAGSADGTTFTTVGTQTTATGASSSTFNTATRTANYKVTLTSIAAYDTNGTGGLSGVGNTATATYSLPNSAPTMDSVDNLNGSPEDTVSTLTYAAIAAASNEYDADGDALSFRVESLGSGTLVKNGAAVTVGTLLSAGESFTWTPPADGYGDFVACTFVSYDGALASTPAANLTVHVEPVNDAPVLTTVATLAGATEDEAFTLHYFTLANAADDSDVDGPAIRFRIESVLTGTLTKGGVAVTPGVTTLVDGESLLWTPPANANGTLAAFTLVASDGLLVSSPAVTVNIQVASVADPAEWDGAAGTGSWSTAANWLDDTVPGSAETIRFTGATPTAITLDATRTVKGLHFSGVSAYTLSGGALVLDAASLTTSSSTSLNQNIASPTQLNGKSVFLLQASAHLRFTGTVTGDEIEKFGPSDLTFTGTTSLTKINAFDLGKIIFSGPANISFFDLNDGATLSATTGVALGITQLKLGGSGTGNLTLTGGADLTTEILDLVSTGTGRGVVTLGDYGTTLTVTNSIAGTAADTITLTTAASLAAPALDTVSVTLSNATLALTGASSSPIDFIGLSNIEINGSEVALTGAITGAGDLYKKGAGTLALGSSHTRTGDTYVAEGALRLTAPTLATDKPLYLLTGTTLALDFTGTQTVSYLILGGNRTYAGTYGGLDSDADYKTALLTGTGTITVTHSDIFFSDWATLSGLDGSAGRAAGETDDPDGDGMANLLEYVLGGDPLASDSAILPATTVSSGYLTLTFTRTDSSENDQALSVETSADLTTWTAHAIGAASSTVGDVTITVTENANAADTIVVKVPATAPRTFARLKIEPGEE